MTRMIVFGAAGHAGGAAVAEARSRGHEVTAPSHREADITDPAAVAIFASKHDTAIVAVTNGHLEPGTFFPAVARGIVAGLHRAEVRRIVWVSLASLLPDAHGVPLMDAPGYPPDFRAFSLAHRTVLDELTESNLQWMAISPSGNFDLDGPSTGGYRLSVGDLNTSITYEDHAMALIDAAEHTQLNRRHLGVASRLQ